MLLFYIACFEINQHINSLYVLTSIYLSAWSNNNLFFHGKFDILGGDQHFLDKIYIKICRKTKNQQEYQFVDHLIWFNLGIIILSSSEQPLQKLRTHDPIFMNT